MTATSISKPTLVVKVGTSTLMSHSKVDGRPAFSLARMGKLVDCICDIKLRGFNVILVTSGAVGAGCVVVKQKTPPTSVGEKQALASIGQCRLIQLYQDLFSVREIDVAQLLMTRTDFVVKSRYNNFRNTILTLLEGFNVIPIINENDSVASSHLRFGDNDTFAAHCAVCISAHALFLLTDVDFLCSFNPRTAISNSTRNCQADSKEADAKNRVGVRQNTTGMPQIVLFAGILDELHHYMDSAAGIQRTPSIFLGPDDEDAKRCSVGDGKNKVPDGGTSWGSGGMRTKLLAARIATTAGIPMGLANGTEPGRIMDMVEFLLSFDTMNRLGSLMSDCDSNQWSKRNSEDTIAAAAKGAITNQATLMLTELKSQVSDLLADTVSVNANGLLSPGRNRGDGATGNSVNTPIQSSLCVIKPQPIETLVNGSALPYIGTIFAGGTDCQSLHVGLSHQRRWIMTLPICGRLLIDFGALRAIYEDRKSLFAAGVLKVEGDFRVGDVVVVSGRNRKNFLRATDKPRPEKRSSDRHSEAEHNHTSEEESGTEHAKHSDHDSINHDKRSSPNARPKPPRSVIGDEDLHDHTEWEEEKIRCLVNFSSEEIRAIMGHHSRDFAEILGYRANAEIAHRANIILFAAKHTTSSLLQPPEAEREKSVTEIH